MFRSRFSTHLAVGRRVVPVAALLGLLLTACSDNNDAPVLPAAPATVAFTQAGLYPEGVQYDAPNNQFLVSSLATGRIGQVKDDGTYSVFADGDSLVSAIGLNLDEPRNRVLVAVSDPGANPQRSSPATRGKLARLAIFNRNSPQTAPVVVNLGRLRPSAPGHFANDVAVDAQGNAYVTDSFAPIIYKVNATTNAATVFVESPQFAGPAGGFGLNGIVFHPDGYLLVAKSDNGVLFKIPLAAPATFSTVTLAAGLDLRNADGLLLQDNNTLQVVCNAQAKVYRLATTNGFAAVTQSGTFSTPPQFPTTLTRRNGASYVLYSSLGALFMTPPQNPPVSQYSINRVDFQ